MSGNAGHRIKTIEERLWSRIAVAGPDDCWLWKGGKSKRPTVHFEGKKQLAYRVAWTLKNGPIPEGKRICHSCDTPRCCNPNHGFAGSAKDNTQDAVRKGRMSHGARHYMAVLNDEIVRSLLNEVASGTPQRQIAKRLKVHVMTINNIITGKTWKHIERKAA